jgi:hypothetical protein
MARALTGTLGAMKAVLIATVSAIAVQPFIFFLLFIMPMLVLGADISWTELLSLPLFAALFAAPLVIAVGIPAFLLLKHLNRLSWQSLGLVGLTVAAAPLAIYSWSEYPGSSSGGSWYGTYVDFVVDGRRTLYGWLSYVQGIVFFAIHGIAGALVFFYVWRRFMAPNNLLDRSRP